jgi:hypothetical protein
VLEHLLDVGGLDTQLVVGAGLVPVPCPRASGEELVVLERSILAFDLEVTPGEVRDLRWVQLLLCYVATPV